MKEIKYKSVDNSVMDVDDKSRTVKNVFNKTNVVDSDDDLITASAFDTTIAQRGPQGKNVIYHLTDHTPKLENTIGKFSALGMDGNNLVGTTTIPKTTLGNDMLEMYKSGVINQHSIGFTTVKSAKKTVALVESDDSDSDLYNDEDDSANIFLGGDLYNDNDDASNQFINVISEVKLYEGSAVLWGANEHTPNISVGKSLKMLTKNEQEELFKKLQKELETLGSFLYKGKMSDETGEILQYRMLQVQDQLQKLFSICFTQPVVKTVEPKEDESAKDEIYKQLLLRHRKLNY